MDIILKSAVNYKNRTKHGHSKSEKAVRGTE